MLHIERIQCTDLNHLDQNKLENRYAQNAEEQDKSSKTTFSIGDGNPAKPAQEKAK